jgi:Na+-translocating ferredoxin:NAD+ oxidoreductase RnfG subunit
VVLANTVLTTNDRVFATTYLSLDEAKKVFWNETAMRQIPVVLNKDQIKQIRKATGVKFRNTSLFVWKTENNGWFIFDKVIGKHEDIDIAISIDNTGHVRGVEVLEYRETYGHEVRNPLWLAQFFGKKHGRQLLKLDRDIQNISGATLSSRHITDSVNKWMLTWELVLKNLTNASTTKKA